MLAMTRGKTLDGVNNMMTESRVLADSVLDTVTKAVTVTVQPPRVCDWCSMETHDFRECPKSHLVLPKVWRARPPDQTM